MKVMHKLLHVEVARGRHNLGSMLTNSQPAKAKVTAECPIESLKHMAGQTEQCTFEARVSVSRYSARAHTLGESSTSASRKR